MLLSDSSLVFHSFAFSTSFRWLGIGAIASYEVRILSFFSRSQTTITIFSNALMKSSRSARLETGDFTSQWYYLHGVELPGDVDWYVVIWNSGFGDLHEMIDSLYD